MAALRREYGISWKTGYKIFERYEECGLEGLSDRTRRPFPDFGDRDLAVAAEIFEHVPPGRRGLGRRFGQQQGKKSESPEMPHGPSITPG